MITFQNLTTFVFIFFWNNSFLPFSYFSDFMSKLAYGNCHLRSLRNRIINLRFDKTTNCSFRHVIILAICILSCNSKCSVQQIYAPFVCNKNFSKIPCNKNVSSHIATEIAILWQSDFISRTSFNRWKSRWMKTQFFNQSESGILLSSATLLALYFPHLFLNNAQSCTKSRHLFASSQKPNHKSTPIAALSQTCCL